MNLGMIGAIGGAGAGLQQESKFLERQDEADAATARQKDFQGWLMQQQQQYEVQREQRAEDRTIRTERRTDRRAEEQKDRDFQRVQTEAPTRRDIKVEDEKASARGKSEVAAETVDTDAGVKQKLTDAGISTPDKGLKKAQADYYNDRGDAAVGKLNAKLDPADAAELKGVQARATKLQETIDKAMAEPGGWDPATNPGQKQLQSNLAALKLRERTILQKYRPEGEAADPLGIRGSKPAAGGAPAPKPAPRPSGMLSQPGDADRAMILNQEMRKARERVASAKGPEERARAEGDVAALEREMRAAGIQVQAAAPAPAAAPRPAAPAPAPAAAAPVDPTEALGRELDASRAELKTLRSNPPGLKAGGAAREQYAAKVQSLREKVRQQERRYADSVGNGGAAFVFR